MAQDQFKIERTGIVMAFDTAKNQMAMIRNGLERVFTKEN